MGVGTGEMSSVDAGRWVGHAWRLWVSTPGGVETMWISSVQLALRVE